MQAKGGGTYFPCFGFGNVWFLFAFSFFFIFHFASIFIVAIFLFILVKVISTGFPPGGCNQWGGGHPDPSPWGVDPNLSRKKKQHEVFEGFHAPKSHFQVIFSTDKNR